MLGQGLGYLAGGIIGDAVGIRAPFDVAFVSFVFVSVYARYALPYAPPGVGGAPVSGFLAPLRVLVLQRLRLADGRAARHYGVVVLCCGIYLGVLATGYAPFLM